MLFVGLSVLSAGVILSGCLSSTATPQAELEENAKKSVRVQMQPLLKATYGKVLNDEELEKLEECVASNVISQLNQNEKLFLGGSATEKVAVLKESKADTESAIDKVKLTSDESKAAIKTCSVAIGVAKAIEKIK